MRFVSFLVGSGSLIGMMLLIRVLLRGRIPPGTYEEWRKEQGLGGTKIEIPFQALTNENIENCGTDRTS